MIYKGTKTALKLTPTIFKTAYWATSPKPAVSPSPNEPRPVTLDFEQHNKFYLNDLLGLQMSKQELRDKHESFITELRTKQKESKRQFERAQTSLSTLYSYIRQQILKEQGFGEESELIQRAHYYFSTEGKKLRPLMIHLLAESMRANTKMQVEKWAALIQMMHIASLAHDDIIDDSPSRRGLQSQHIKYGKKSAVFSANFVISKAETIHQFNSSRLYQIYSLAMDNLANGQIIQAVNRNKIYSSEIPAPRQRQELRTLIQTYMNKSYYKTAALMANALRAVPLLCHMDNHQAETTCFRIGQHFGIAFQLVDDIIDYTSSAEEMGKQNLADICQGNMTGPVYFTLWSDLQQGKDSSALLKLLRTSSKSKERALQVKRFIEEGKGIELAYELADKHIQKGIQYISKLPIDKQNVWKYLGLKVLSRTK